MQVNNLESREVLIMMFGVPLMLAAIVLASIAVGHVVTTRSDRPTSVQVSASTPKIDVNVPQAAAPNIQVAAAAPKIDVNVPQAAAPIINVTPPPAVVTVVDHHQDIKQAETKQPEKQAEAKPAVSPPAQAPTPTPATPEPKKTSALEGKDVDTLYLYAERYIASYCKKNNLEPAAEAQNWTKKWKQGLEQAMADNVDSDEQAYINRVAVAKRDCFDIDKAPPEKVVEGCRIILRYRDGKLTWLSALREAASANMEKTLVFLAAGVR